ncbi:MAG: transketolase [Gemmatimonadota bacterium]|nr:transketolase [Gemmatimonadota bacterium]
MSDSAVAARTVLDQVCINTVRTLAMDAVERATAGHPGTPMALAPLGYVLWTRHLRHSPADPTWPGRDRFVLSCGHASMLLYSLLHLSGYDLSLDDLMAFRQWESRTPGHPEHGMTPGVETTTGPLGQGFGNAVGMALAAAHLGAIFNRPRHRVVDQRVYVLLSDGDLMEGISHEVASLAGHLRLGNLVALFDDNGITIDGPTSLSCSDDVARRFEAYGWHVQRVADGNDLDAIDRALDAAKAEQGRPSFIIVRTHIGYGSPNKQDTAAAHGSPLGEEEVRLAKRGLGWPYDKPFTVPAEALAEWRRCVPRGQSLQAEWDAAVAAYADAEPEAAAELRRRLGGRLPDGWEQTLPTFGASDGPMATRTASGKVLNAVASAIPELLGGSADLAGSNDTLVKGAPDLGPNHLGGRNVYFGIREHGMASVMNGMALHGGVIPYGGTFLVFSDYMRPAIRLAAMMGLRVIYVFTHDSIGLGEDGPTHQPVETLTALRAIPNLTVIRPGDAAETVQAWRVALRGHGPVALVLTRQKVPTLDRTILADAEGLVRGAYVLADPEDGPPEVILLASGSELALVVDAGRRLSSMSVRVRVVSVPSLELFRAQPEEYRRQVLPPAARARLAVEAADMTPWHPWVGDGGEVLGMASFGKSAPSQRLFSEFGLTPEVVVDRVRRLIGT